MEFTIEFYETSAGRYLVHGIRKKTRVLLARDRQVALERKRDWLTRNLP